MKKLVWCAALVACAMVNAVASSAQPLTTLFDFNGTNGNGSSAPLAQGRDGNLYGTNSSGGTKGYGTVFTITPAGALTTLYNFCSQPNCTDGFAPAAGLVQGGDENFYGTTFEGGSGNCNYVTGQRCGTVFKISSAGALTTLYNFGSKPNCADGGGPNGLVKGKDGDFYGTSNQNGANNAGTVFKITSAGALTTLYSFCSKPGCSDGSAPVAALIQGTDGNFYGTTWTGGTTGAGGTVFKITSAGALTTLYNFCSETGCNGGYPSGALVQASDDNFYGTTAHGGTIFKITPEGALTTLATVGGFPYAGLVQAADGNFYGTTYVGGTNNANFCQNNGCGSIFKITPTGTLSTLYNFCAQANCADGIVT